MQTHLPIQSSRTRTRPLSFAGGNGRALAEPTPANAPAARFRAVEDFLACFGTMEPRLPGHPEMNRESSFASKEGWPASNQCFPDKIRRLAANRENDS